jgi:hypothetical protein
VKKAGLNPVFQAKLFDRQQMLITRAIITAAHGIVANEDMKYKAECFYGVLMSLPADVVALRNALDTMAIWLISCLA